MVTKNKECIRVSRFKRIGILVVGLILSFTKYGVADTVTAKGSVDDGVAQIIFSWPAPIPFVARIQNRSLFVQFSRPAEGNFSGLTKSLAKYIKVPEARDGNRTLVFPLLGDYDLNYFPRGRNAVVQIIDTSPPIEKVSAARPPAVKAPADKAPAVKAPAVKAPAVKASSNRQKQTKVTGKALKLSNKKMERVAIRTGKNPAYSRIVFDWKKRVEYKVSQRQNLATIVFDRPAEITVSPLNIKGFKNVRGARTKLDGRSTTVALSISSTSKLQHFRAGSKIIVDVRNPTGVVDAPPIERLTAELFRLKKPASKVVASPKTKGQKLKSTKVRKASKKMTLKKARKVKLGEKKICAPMGNKPEIPTLMNGKTVSMRVDWKAPVGAAVFRRAGNLWLIFNKAEEFDVCKLRAQAGRALTSITQEPSERSTILRVGTVDGLNPSIRRSGFAWIFDFKMQPLRPETPIAVNSKPTSPIGPHIVIPISDVGKVVQFKDTTVYDNLFIIPVTSMGYGVGSSYNYPQLNVLPSAQGVVIKPNVDDLRVESISEGVKISSVNKLALSTLTTKIANNSGFGSMQALSRIYKSGTWKKVRRQKPGQFYKLRREMFARLTTLKGEAKEKARMDLALFLIGNGYGYEANGFLKIIKEESPQIAEKSQYRFLRGATDFLMGRYKESLKALMHPSMYGNDEGEYWRAAAKLAAGEDIINASKFMIAKGNILTAYPREIKMKLGILTAKAAVITEDMRAGIKYLGVLAKVKPKPKPKEIDQLALIEGRFKKISGDFAGAIKAWEEVEKGEHLPSIMNAILSRNNLQLTTKKIKAKEAIADLNKLRFAWRGDDFEFSLLRKLGELYVEVADYRNGLRTMRSAVSNFRGNKNSSEITKQMESAFVELYLNNAADKMTPLRALALFEEFKELTPSGNQGDEMIRKLADRLASVDLLDRAAKLLEQQVSFRLAGAEKARVGAQLATVYILNKEPKKAIEALEKSNFAGQPELITAQRRRLNVRALIDLKRNNEALVPLEDDDSKEADMLRVEIYWATNWPKAANILQKLLVNTGAAPGRKLSEKQAQSVLNFGIALSFSANNRGVKRLSKDYLKEMDATPFKDAFRLIASPDSAGLIDYRTIASRVQTVSNFQNFMTIYRERLKSGKLSQLY